MELKLNLSNCLVKNDNFIGSVEAVLKVPRAAKSKKAYDLKSKRGTVLLVDVTDGVLAPGMKITIGDQNTSVTDTVVEIERDRNVISYATRGDAVGLCLENLSVSDFSPFSS